MHNVFLHVWKNHWSWKPKGTIKSYLYKAVHNQCRNHARQQKVEKKWRLSKKDETNAGYSTEEEYYNDELQKELELAVEKLPERCKLIFLLSRVNGLKYKEIASELNISIKTVEVQMGRALKKLRQYLGPFISS